MVSFTVVGVLTRSADSYWQVVLMAASRASVFILIFLPLNFVLLRLVSGVKGKDLLTASWPSMLTGLTIFVAVRLLALWLPQTHMPLPVQVALEGLVAVVVGGACLLAVDGEARAFASSALRWARARLPANLRCQEL
jgi:hypothetical protein